MYLFTNENVFRGHPDRVCDQIGNALLDACLSQDPYSRCGIEVSGGKNKLFITGEVTSRAYFDVRKIARRVLKENGYNEKIEIIVNISEQSPDIAQGTREEDLGAGDNGIMYGYASAETDEYLPKAVVILKKFVSVYDILRKYNRCLYADGKCELTGVYDDDGTLLAVKRFTICYSNNEKKRDVWDKNLETIARRICEENQVECDEVVINPTGRFELCGFDADAGVLGRKIVADTYEGFGRVGGGTMNGKDPTKVDVSGAYYARKLAVDVLKNNHGLKWVEVQIAYCIGKKEPCNITIFTDKGILDTPYEYYAQGEPSSIIAALDLRRPDWERKAWYGHF